MVKSVKREDVQRLVTQGAQVVEVLPQDEYDELHIAGALSIPLKELGDRAPRELDHSRPVVAYCHDFL